MKKPKVRRWAPTFTTDPLRILQAQRRRGFAHGFLRFTSEEPISACRDNYERDGWQRAELIARHLGKVHRGMAAALARAYGNAVGKKRKLEPDDPPPKDGTEVE